MNATLEWVVCMYRDVHLPAGWDRRPARQFRVAERNVRAHTGCWGVLRDIRPEVDRHEQ